MIRPLTSGGAWGTVVSSCCLSTSCTDPTGTPFDANLHQAMTEAPSAEHAPGTVVQAHTQVWTLNGRLLRPAMVVVAKAAGSDRE